MYVAKVTVLTAHGIGAGADHNVFFGRLEDGEAEYRRIADLMTRHRARANDGPDMVVLKGDGGEATFALADAHSVSLCDYAKQDKEQAGVRDAFPNLFKR
jgi:hypothetical protein